MEEELSVRQHDILMIKGMRQEVEMYQTFYKMGLVELTKHASSNEQ